MLGLEHNLLTFMLFTKEHTLMGFGNRVMARICRPHKISTIQYKQGFHNLRYPPNIIRRFKPRSMKLSRNVACMID
jgi:hypothetical protein